MFDQPTSALASFRNRRYLTYWLTGLAANFGWLIQLVGASWLMTSIGGTPEMVALVQTAIALPIMLFSLPAGAVADAFGRRAMVLWSQTLLLTVSVGLAACAYLGVLTPWSLLAFTFLIGSGKALKDPGWQTFVSEFVPRSELPSAVALNGVGFNLARSVGPAIGGVIVATIGAFAAFVVNAVANLAVIIVASRWRSETDIRQLPPESIGPAMVAGLRYVALSPEHLLVLLRAALFTFSACSLMALMPLVARDLVDGGPRTYGLLLGGFGIGAIGGAVVGSRFRQALSPEAQARTSFVTVAGALSLIALSPNFFLSMLGAAFAGAAWLLTMSAFNATIQMSSPRWVVSRCLALYQAVCFGGIASGSWLWGALASTIGTSGALLVSALTVLLAAAIGLRLALREPDFEGLDPHTPWTPPNIAVDMVPTSGPIFTTVEYRIREEDVPEFMRVMVDRRRSRIRDGARRWTLSRDISNPEIWFERYKTPTWIENERHHFRRTVAGSQLADRIRALHQGEERPKVRHELVRHPDAPTSNDAIILRGGEH